MLFLVYMPFCVDSRLAILHLGDSGATASSHWSLGHGFWAGWWGEGAGLLRLPGTSGLVSFTIGWHFRENGDPIWIFVDLSRLLHGCTQCLSLRVMNRRSCSIRFEPLPLSGFKASHTGQGWELVKPRGRGKRLHPVWAFAHHGLFSPTG
jgi:hypothetical protein